MKNNMKKTLKEDLESPLDDMERAWLRRSILILITPFILIAGALWGACSMMDDMYRDCWNYNSKME